MTDRGQPVSPTPDHPVSPTAQPSVAAPEDGPVEQPESRPVGRGKLLPIVLGGLCLVLAVVVAVLAIRAVSDAGARTDDQAALEAARASTPLILSYGPATVDQDIETARAQLTGKFAAQFDQLVNQLVLPAAKQQGLTSKCVTTHAALTDAPSADPRGRDVLVVLEQQVSGPNAPPQQTSVQVRVTVVETPEGTWKVADLQVL